MMSRKNIICTTGIAFSISLFFISCTGKTGEKEREHTPGNDSLSIWNEQINEDSGNAELYHQRANYLLRHGDYNSAAEDEKTAIGIDSTKTAYYLTLSDIYFASDKTRNSKAMLEKALAMDPENTEALLKLAELYFLVKKYQEAFDHVNKALKVDPYIARAYFMKGMIYKEMKDTTRAISSMITAVEQDPKHYDAYMQLGLLYTGKKDRLSVAYFDNAIRIKPKSGEALYAKGKFYQDVEDWDQAISTYSLLLQHFPDNKHAHYNLGVINGGAKKDYETALKNFDAAIKTDPDYFQAYYGRGTCYELLGDKQKALENYREALKIKPDYEPAVESIRSITN